MLIRVYGTLCFRLYHVPLSPAPKQNKKQTFLFKYDFESTQFSQNWIIKFVRARPARQELQFKFNALSPIRKTFDAFNNDDNFHLLGFYFWLEFFRTSFIENFLNPNMIHIFVLKSI